jgi:hypothetical protein
MKKALIAMALTLSSVSAFSVSTDRDLFVQVTSSTNPTSGTVTEEMFGTLAYEQAHEENSFVAVNVSSSGYIYFQAREQGVNFSCYVHESVKTAEEMEYFKTIAAAFNNGARIRVTKYGHNSYCNGAYMNKNSWQHLN